MPVRKRSNHAGALYTVRARVKRSEDCRPFGDLNGDGAYLGQALLGYLDGMTASNDDNTRTVSCDSVQLRGHDLEILVRHGQSGVAGDLVDKDGNHKARQTITDSQLVRCGALLRLPRDATLGWLCVHLNNQRSSKTLLVDELRRSFRDDFSNLILEVEPCQLGAVLKEAVEGDRVDRVSLIRLDRAADRANPAVDKWVRGGVDARLELDITARHGLRLLPTLVRRFLAGETAAFGEIVEFQGLHFDTAKVEVELPNGRKRTFNIERPDAGHPITEDLDEIKLGRDGDSTAESLFAALRAVITGVAG